MRNDAFSSEINWLGSLKSSGRPEKKAGGLADGDDGGDSQQLDERQPMNSHRRLLIRMYLLLILYGLGGALQEQAPASGCSSKSAAQDWGWRVGR
ncbi:MAG: hypothetical protein ABFD69_13900 [Candidatus Sumerlaeia bacterium]